MNPTKNFFTIFALLLLLVAGKTPTYDVGDAVADFKLKNVDGKMVALNDYKSSNGMIIVFDCNTCPYSKAYNDRIIALNKNYAPKGYPVVAINANNPEQSPGDSFDEMIKHAKKHRYDFPYLVDETQQVAKVFGASNTPHVFVLQKTGHDFKVVYMGAIDNNTRDASAANKKYVEQAVDELLASKAVSIPKTKAIGCGIRWKNS